MEPVIEARSLVKHFPIDSGVFGRRVDYLKAVDGVSFAVHRGETLGLVGESGGGKTTCIRSGSRRNPVRPRNPRWNSRPTAQSGQRPVLDPDV